MKQIAVILVLLFFSCSDNLENESTLSFQDKYQPFIINREPGIYLEWAIEEHAMIDPIKNIICDTLELNPELIIQKIRYTTNDPMESFERFFYLSYIEEGISCGRTKVINEIVFNLDSPDAFYWNKEKYENSNLLDIIDSISSFYNYSLSKLIEADEFNNCYIPRFHFIINANSYSCKDNFIEKVVHLDTLIKNQMSVLSEKVYKESFKITPLITIVHKQNKNFIPNHF